MTEDEKTDLTHIAKQTLRDFLLAKKDALKAEEAFKQANKRAQEAGRQARAVDEQSNTRVIFQGPDGLYYRLFPVRGDGIAIRRIPASWTLEGKLIVDASDILGDKS